MASQRREVALGRNMERIDIMGNSKQQAIIAVAATIVLSGCGLIKPRDAGYFRFHAEEARLVVTRCERGQEPGSDCEAAAQAVAEPEIGKAAGRERGCRDGKISGVA